LLTSWERAADTGAGIGENRGGREPRVGLGLKYRGALADTTGAYNGTGSEASTFVDCKLGLVDTASDLADGSLCDIV